MPFKSKAQRRKFAELLIDGTITPEVFEEWNRETGAKRLPERAHPSRKGKAKSGAKRSAAKARKTGVARKRTSRSRVSKKRRA